MILSLKCVFWAVKSPFKACMYTCTSTCSILYLTCTEDLLSKYHNNSLIVDDIIQSKAGIGRYVQTMLNIMVHTCPAAVAGGCRDGAIVPRCQGLNHEIDIKILSC